MNPDKSNLAWIFFLAVFAALSARDGSFVYTGLFLALILIRLYWAVRE